MLPVDHQTGSMVSLLCPDASPAWRTRSIRLPEWRVRNATASARSACRFEAIDAGHFAHPKQPPRQHAFSAVATGAGHSGNSAPLKPLGDSIIAPAAYTVAIKKPRTRRGPSFTQG